jgi:hypothetical protein
MLIYGFWDIDEYKGTVHNTMVNPYVKKSDGFFAKVEYIFPAELRRSYAPIHAYR